MEHYDGPAFFRRPPRKKAENKVNENKRIFQENQYQNEYRHRSFHPSYIPPSTLNLRSKNLKQKYDFLVSEIQKTDDDYLLFAINDNLPLVDLVDSQARINALEIKGNDAKKENEEKKSASHNENDKNQGEIYESLSSHVSKEDNIKSPKVQPTMSQCKELPLNNKKTDSEQASLESSSIFNKNISSNTSDLPPRVEKHLNSSTRENLQDINVKESEENNSDLREPKIKSSVSPVEVDREEKKAISQNIDSSFASSLTSHLDEGAYHLPSLSLLPAPVSKDNEPMEEWALSQAEVLNNTFKAFHVNAQVQDWTVGPTVTQFEVTVGLGVKVSKITNLSDDLKLALAAKDIRIEAPIAGKSSVGIEIPNKYSRPVMLAEVFDSPQFKNAKSPLTVALGVDLFGVPQVTNIHEMPHGLIAGATGSGKSVFINSLLVSLLYKATPQEVKLLLIDPKTVELAPYEGIPHLLAPVISDSQAATASLKWAVEEMNERYEKLAAAGVRDIDAFNQKAHETGEEGLKLPYIVIIIDELADLMMTASAEISEYISQITAKARAAGIHLLVATQRPSVDVITGTMKNNIPTRIAFMVSSQIDSRTILDTAGAEKLLGRGDMLYLGNGKSQPKRLQGTYIDDEKIDEVVNFVKQQAKPHYAFDPDNLKKKELDHENEDEIMPRVLDYIVSEETTSTSKLQRVFSIGYNRAARIIEQLEKKQYISPARGSKPRKIFLTEEELDKLRGD